MAPDQLQPPANNTEEILRLKNTQKSLLLITKIIAVMVLAVPAWWVATNVFSAIWPYGWSTGLLQGEYTFIQGSVGLIFIILVTWIPPTRKFVVIQSVALFTLLALSSVVILFLSIPLN